ncbi:hypothetical protein K503DRAFT_727529 [Rhizopogon vinicolor AM-OR11-026]|uniref:Heterokaryon incompatibility domain-containing protein n=1 Tax=Rhizopogon vinicolor AM-OR11-026 TaxID=1314800 RepID=A0A1B7MH10_9AGAM|nr:hypothetical protein K503DRAFT_727529 [Rhizopogon vinicolor AM-OR11-026]
MHRLSSSESATTPPEVVEAIQIVIDAQLDNVPFRLLNTTSVRLCDRGSQTTAFKRSTEYAELLSFTTKLEDPQMERIKEVVVMYFRYAMLSHRWEGEEPQLHYIQDKVVYELSPVGGIAKLQSFCKVARDAGYRWAWVDTCCINQTDRIDVQGSVSSKFTWYRNSALTIVYLSDVLPLSKASALAKSAWITRGWTLPELLAARVVLFYQKDWTLYLDDRSPNHKESVAIIQELEDATGIDKQALLSFRPRMRNAREILQWAASRVTTLREDIVYSLRSIFDVHIPVIYGGGKQNALGRLLQEIVAESGDVTVLDWVGKSSEFHSCLPADIASYGSPSYTLPSLSEDDMQTPLSLLRNASAPEFAVRLYTMLNSLCVPRFAARRLHLPCIVFRVMEVRGRYSQEQETY